MIEQLRIRNLALVELAELELDAGLNVLTGETGAGKSLVLNAFSLLAGSRASADAVGSADRIAQVEAILRPGRFPGLDAALAEHDLLAEDDALVVARTVGRDGRGRVQIAGRWVPVATLRELLAGRLEISSQHATQSLRRGGQHTEFLDVYAGTGSERSRVAQLHGDLRRCAAALHGLREAAATRARQRDFLEFQRDEIDAAGIRDGEFAALGAELRRLSHADELLAGSAAVRRALIGDGTGEAGAALDGVDLALRELGALTAADAKLQQWEGRLVAVREELDDLAREVERYADRLEVDPARLSAVEERLGELEALRRKYGADEAEILAHRAAVAAELDALAGDHDRGRELAAESERLCRELSEAAGRLARRRRRAARSLSREVETALGGLDMPGARFEVTFAAVSADEGLPSGAGGTESAEFRFTANPDTPPKPLQKVASGGELSRVFLALQRAQLDARESGGTVLVFDEVDVGIGGRAIDHVGGLLQELGASHQIVCITHWPQIAAAATRHFRVSKGEVGGRTTTRVERLDEAQRVDELARMAGGARVTSATRRHARDLLRERRSGASPPPARPTSR